MDNGAFVIVAPNSMAFRAIVNSDVLPQLQYHCENSDENHYSKIWILSQNDGSQELLPDYIEWRNCLSPATKVVPLTLKQKILRALSTRLSSWFGFGYANTVFRFNHLNQFFAHQFKQSMNQERRKREELAGNFVSKKYGFPFPNSKKIYQWIYDFYYSEKQVADPNIQSFFSEINISKLVFWHVQTLVFREYSICARQKKVPYIGVIGSWDRPTTKGPICPDCSKYIVNSRVMRDELITHHSINADLIEVVGWPQMDIYHDSSLQLNRSDFLNSLAINTDQVVLLYAGNASRLGAHEPSIVEHIAEKINKQIYGKKIHLIIRPHPQDVDWQNRYSVVKDQSNITVMPAEMGNVTTMVNTLMHADIIIATQGSISLDAAALDKKIINIAFDGNLSRSYSESVKRWYEMDHYRPVVESNGVAIANSFQQLDEIIILLMNEDPNQQGRKQLREIELEPFQGDSSTRQVSAMLS